MSKESKKILVAVAWPYVNGDLHPGHLSGYLLPADIFARYHRLKGNDVLMVSGSDCHGTPTLIQADNENKTPEQIVDKYHKKDIELFRAYNLSYNLYTKTTTEIHKIVTQDFFIELLKKDYIKKGIARQYYSPIDNQFLPDRYVIGICPHCDSRDQRSDQCESCGRWLGEGELIDPKSKLTGKEVILKDTEHYFLDLSKLEKSLRKYVDSKEGIWRKWVWKEADGWLREGLKKRAISRDISWGIDLPVERIKKLSKDKQLADFNGKRLYVWFEAVIGYLSAAQEWSQTEKKNDEIIFNRFSKQSTDWKEWWLNSKSEHHYFMGQDNLIFHTLMWPGQLIGLDEGYILPHNAAVNRFMNYEGKKFSKGNNWIIDSMKLAEDYGVDSVRFYLASNFPENKEASFSWDDFYNSINNELVANLGNFVHRTLKFIEGKYDGKIEIKDFKVDDDVRKNIEETFSKASQFVEKAELVNGLREILRLTSFGNKYFDKNKIWELYKKDSRKAENSLLNLVNIIYNLPVLLYPYLPDSSQKLAKLLQREIDKEVNPGNNLWKPDFINKIRFKKEISPLFKKIEKTEDR